VDSMPFEPPSMYFSMIVWQRQLTLYQHDICSITPGKKPASTRPRQNQGSMGLRRFSSLHSGLLSGQGFGPVIDAPKEWGHRFGSDLG
jgi:hypothetical protein